MKSVRQVSKYQARILRATDNRHAIPLDSIKYDLKEKESFQHALADLIIDGMIHYSALNRKVMIKRIA